MDLNELFWNEFRTYAGGNVDFIQTFILDRNNKKGKNWFDIHWGGTFTPEPVHLVFRVKNDELIAEYYIRGKNAEIYQHLMNSREEMEEIIGCPMTFSPTNGRSKNTTPVDLKIYMTKSTAAKKDEKDKWNEWFDWYMQMSWLMKEAFEKFVF